MPQGSLAEILNQEILAAARAAVAEMYQPVNLFDSLPEVSGISELADYYKTSSKVIAKMAHDGMPHTHVGREFRFHRSLLIEWTRTGECPIPCATCNAGKNKEDEPPTTPEEKIETAGNISIFEQNKKRDQGLAKLVG